MATKLRNFRLDDELWEAMGVLAKSRGSTRTSVVVEGVRRLLADPSGDWGVDSPFLPPELAGAPVGPGSVAERLLVEPGERQVFSRKAVVEANGEPVDAARMYGAAVWCPDESVCFWSSVDAAARCPVHDMRRKVK